MTLELALIAFLSTQPLGPITQATTESICREELPDPEVNFVPQYTTIATSPVSCTGYSKTDKVVPGAVAGFLCVAVTSTYLGIPIEAQLEGAFFRKRNGRILCTVHGPIDLIDDVAYVSGCGLNGDIIRF